MVSFRKKLPEEKGSMAPALAGIGIFIRDLSIYRLERILERISELLTDVRVYVFVSEYYLDVSISSSVPLYLMRIDSAISDSENVRNLCNRAPEKFFVSYLSLSESDASSHELPREILYFLQSLGASGSSPYLGAEIRAHIRAQFPFSSDGCRQVPPQYMSVGGTNLVKAFYGSDFILFRASSRLIVNMRSQILKKEPDTIDWIHNIVEPNQVVFDIGSNIGTYALVIGSLYFGSTEVFAFEPMEANFSELKYNIEVNGLKNCIRAFDLALSDVDGEGTLSLSSNEPGTALHSLGKMQIEGVALAAIQKVKTCTLDSFTRERNVYPNHIKIDVDGFEPEIIRGATETLSNSALRSILIELDLSSERDSSCLEQIRSFGFEIYHVQRKPSVGVYSNSNLANVILVRKGKQLV